MRRLEGKIALVTGGSSGIGRATAFAFARAGAKVMISDILEIEGQNVVTEIIQEGGVASFFKANISIASQVEALIAKTVEIYGRLDCAFNNAGIEGTVVPLIDYTEEDWDRMMEVNLKGTWLCMKYEIGQMLRQGQGSIVNNASVAGILGLKGFAPYCASKGGVIMLTRAGALEYTAMGIRINVICPGGILTPLMERALQASGPAMREKLIAMHPIGRLGTVEECALPVVWLCSDDASFVSGHAFFVDGGFVAGKP